MLKQSSLLRKHRQSPQGTAVPRPRYNLRSNIIRRISSRSDFIAQQFLFHLCSNQIEAFKSCEQQRHGARAGVLPSGQLTESVQQLNYDAAARSSCLHQHH